MSHEQRLNEIRHRAEKATSGPWFLMLDGFSNKPPANCPTVYATDEELRYIACFRDVSISGAATPNVANATFTAHARDDIPYLLDRVAVLERLVREYQEAFNASDGEGERY